MSHLKFLILFLYLLNMTQIFESSFEKKYFAQTRYYDSKLGRFVNVDAVAPRPDSQGKNRYAYTYNNPIKYDDPDGHTPRNNNRSNEVKSYYDAKAEYESQMLASLGYTGSSQQSDNVLGMDGARAGQISAFGIRGALKLKFTPTMEALISSYDKKVAAKFIYATHIGDEIETLTSSMDLISPKLANLGSTVYDAGLHIDDAIELGDARIGTYRSIEVLDGQAMRRAVMTGLKAGLSQTPPLFAPNPKNMLPIAISGGFNRGVKLPLILGAGGGILGFSSSLHYENDIAKIAGLAGAGLEITAVASIARDTRIISAASGASLATRSTSVARIAYAGVAGLVGGVVSIGAWLIHGSYEAGGWEDPAVHPSITRKEAEESGPRPDIKDWKGDNLEPCQGSYCLLEGTLVWTPLGLKKIEKIQVGDFVSSFLNERSQSKVTFASENKIDHWLQIKTSRGALNLTKNHPIKIRDRGWVLAGEVAAGDFLVSYKVNQPEGDFKVLDIQKVQNFAKVYNLQIESRNEFFVTSSGVLVGGLE